MSLKPPQRRVPARVHTGSGWLSGTIHLPRMQGFVEFLSAGDPTLPLTEVSLPGQRSPIPFFALRRAAAELVVPTCAEWLVGTGPAGAGRPGAAAPRASAGEARLERMVCCLLQAGTVTGRMELEPGLRVSDFVAQHEGFLVLRHAVLGPAHEPAALVFVNARACVGVGDLGPQGAGAGAPGEVEIEVELEEVPPGSDMPA